MKHTKGTSKPPPVLSLGPAAQKPHDRYTVREELDPDFLIRSQIRRLNQRRLKSEAQKHANGYKAELVKELKSSPIAIETIAANDQHYEVPPGFLRDAWVNISNIVAATGQMRSRTSIKLNQACSS